MFNIVSGILLIVIILDLRVLRELRGENFKRVFGLSKLYLFFVLGVLTAIFIVTGKFFFFGSVALSLYLLRRNQLKRSSFRGQEDDFRKKILSDAFGVFLHWYYAVLIFSFCLSKVIVFYKPLNSELGEIVILGFFSSFMIVLLITSASRKFSSRGFFYNIGLFRPKRSAWSLFVFPAFLGILFSLVASLIVILRPVQPQTPMSDVLETSTSTLSLILFVLLAIIVAPLIEELTFRGYFFNVLKKVKGKYFAFYTVAIVFGLLHMPQYWGDWLAIIVVMILGFVLTSLRLWQKTVLPGTVTHYFYNGGMVLFPVLFILLSNPAYFQYSVWYENYNDEQKETLLLKSIENKPDLSEAYNDLAWLYAKQKRNLPKALELINKALELRPRTSAYLDTKIKILLLQDQREQAERVRDDLLEIRPKWPVQKYFPPSDSDSDSDLP